MKGWGWALVAAGAAAVAFAGRAVVASWQALADGCRTGDDALDRWCGRVAAELWTQTLGSADVTDARACMSIIKNEGGAAAGPLVGDATLGGGPSIGPMQVYRSTAKALALWSPPEGATDDQERTVYAALATDEARCLSMGVAVYLNKLEAAGGDVADAIRRFNGGGTAAQAYQARALTFAQDTWGGLSA